MKGGSSRNSKSRASTRASKVPKRASKSTAGKRVKSEI